MLYEQALELAFASMPDDDSPLFPFALTTANGKLAHTTIVTSNSHKAMATGRRMVLESKADEYAIVTDTYIRVDGERFDALMVEYGDRDGASVMAQRYRDKQKLGERLDVERRPSALVPLDPFTLDWGGITPDMYNEPQNLAVHTVMHALHSPEQIERTARFLRSRARVFRAALPPNAKQIAFFNNQQVDRAALAKAIGPDLAVQFKGDK